MNFHLIAEPIERVNASLQEIAALGAGKGNTYRPFLASAASKPEALESRAAALAPKSAEDATDRKKLNQAMLARALVRDAAYQRHCWRKAKVLGWQNHHRAVYERGRKELELA